MLKIFSCASNNDLDMWCEMRIAAFLGKLIANDPEAVPAEKVDEEREEGGEGRRKEERRREREESGAGG